MPAKPCSHKTYMRRYNQNTRELKALTQKPEPINARPAHLNMTDEEIDKTYWTTGKADRTRMKKEAAKERLRIEVQKELSVELCGDDEYNFYPPE